MVSVGQVLVFALTAFVLIVVPGPSVLFTIGRALSVGRRAALLTVAGNAVGLCLQVAAVALGLGALVAESVAAFTALKLVGAAYLIYLGVRAIRHRRDRTSATDVTLAPARTRRVLWEGFVVGATNPKMIVFLAAGLPQFVDRDAGQVTAQMLALGAVVAVVALVSDSVWALAAGTARTWLARSPRRVETMGGAGGLAMIGVGAGLAVSGRPD